MEPLSNLSHIEIKDSSNPATLIQEWAEDAKNCGSPVFTMTLGTSTKTGKVSTRHVVIKEIMSDSSLTFTTQIRSNKVKDMEENPQVSATILLNYFRNDMRIVRQMNFMGVAMKLPREKCKIYFENQTLPAKVRSWVCQECTTVDRNELKTKYEGLLREADEGKVLEMPEGMVAYRVVPNKIDFYYTYGNIIADRIVFEQENGQWKWQRMMP